MGGEENVKLVPFDRSASVDDFDRGGAVTGDQQFGAEGKLIGVRCYKFAFIIGNLMPAGGDALGVLTTALFARAVGSHFHADGANFMFN